MKRDADGRARLAALKAKLVDGPVLRLPLGKFGYQFNPQTLQPLGDLGTVYPTMRLTDAWGTIDVENGAFLELARSVRAGNLAPLPAKEAECTYCSVSGGCRKPRFAMAPDDDEEPE